MDICVKMIQLSGTIQDENETLSSPSLLPYFSRTTSTYTKESKLIFFQILPHDYLKKNSQLALFSAQEQYN